MHERVRGGRRGGLELDGGLRMEADGANFADAPNVSGMLVMPNWVDFLGRHLYMSTSCIQISPRLSNVSRLVTSYTAGRQATIPHSDLFEDTQAACATPARASACKYRR